MAIKCINRAVALTEFRYKKMYRCFAGTKIVAVITRLVY